MAAPEDWRGADAALRRGRWSEAAASYAAIAAETGDPTAREGVARAAWWLDDAELALAAREAAYRGFRDAGDDRGAARAATALGYDSMLFGRGVAVGRGWLARAAELLDGRVDLPEAGWLAVRRAEVALNVDHDPDAALDAATHARQVGRTIGDADLVIVAQALAGLADVRRGDIAGGMPLLDRAAAAATAGDIDDVMWVGKICCWLISACRETHDLGRAGEWCARVEDICVQRDLSPLFAVCRTQYASILLDSGHDDEAERTLVDVLGRLRESRRLSRLDAIAQLGELRRRQRRFAEAEDLLVQAGYGPAALTSLARLRLDTGDSRAAWTAIAELVRSFPAGQLLGRVDALVVAVAVGVAAGHPAESRAAAEELGSLAARIDTPAVHAHAAAARARLAEPAQSVEHWQDAARLFRTAGLVRDEAEARIGLAASLRDREAAQGSPPPGEDEDHQPVDRQLTDRQGDVLRLVARGLSNAEIAAELHLSEHTVHRHVANIYTALDVGSRAEAAVYAATHRLS